MGRSTMSWTKTSCSPFHLLPLSRRLFWRRRRRRRRAATWYALPLTYPASPFCCAKLSTPKPYRAAASPPLLLSAPLRAADPFLSTWGSRLCSTSAGVRILRQRLARTARAPANNLRTQVMGGRGSSFFRPCSAGVAWIERY